METEHRISNVNSLFEARLRLRENVALETLVLKHVIDLPEDDFCHHARESLQLGAGYAYLKMEDGIGIQKSPVLTAEEISDVFDIFFAVQPQNRYLTREAVLLQQKEVMFAVLHPDIQDTSRADIYEIEAAAAFLDGYALVRS